jgi:hypothetical protein
MRAQPERLRKLLYEQFSMASRITIRDVGEAAPESRSRWREGTARTPEKTAL